MEAPGRLSAWDSQLDGLWKQKIGEAGVWEAADLENLKGGNKG